MPASRVTPVPVDEPVVPEMTLRVAAVVPPMVLSLEPIAIPPPVFPSAAVPAAFKPIRLP